MRNFRYLIYRHGCNASNQSMRERMPVAVVEATSRGHAILTVRHDPPGRLDVHMPSYLALDDSVTVWANQRLSAIPVSKARRADLAEVEGR